MKPALLAAIAQPSKPVGPATAVTQNSQVHACAQPHVPIKSAPNLQTRPLRLKFARLAVSAAPLKPAGLVTVVM